MIIFILSPFCFYLFHHLSFFLYFLSVFHHSFLSIFLYYCQVFKFFFPSDFYDILSFLFLFFFFSLFSPLYLFAALFTPRSSKMQTLWFSRLFEKWLQQCIHRKPRCYASYSRWLPWVGNGLFNQSSTFCIIAEWVTQKSAEIVPVILAIFYLNLFVCTSWTFRYKLETNDLISNIWHMSYLLDSYQTISQRWGENKTLHYSWISLYINYYYIRIYI